VSTNVYCDHCAQEVDHDDSFVVESEEVVRAYHFSCGAEIYNALQAAIMRHR